MKIIKAVLSEKSENALNELKSSNSKINSSIINAITTKIGFIKSDMHYGDPIAKKLIPKSYVVEYGLTNLFRVGLPDYWRMMYTLVDGSNPDEIIAFIIEIIDHHQYDKRFGYKKR